MKEPRLEKNQTIRELFRRLLVEEALEMSDEEVEWVQHFIEHNELEIAFDEMLAILRKDRIAVTAEQFSLIVELGAHLSGDHADWANLPRKA